MDGHHRVSGPPAGAVDPLDLAPKMLSQEADGPNFYAHGRLYRFSHVALGCIPATNPLRKKLVWLITSKVFENFVLFLIVLNSISLGMVDFSNVDPETYQPVAEVRASSPPLPAATWRSQPPPPPPSRSALRPRRDRGATSTPTWRRPCFWACSRWS